MDGIPSFGGPATRSFSGLIIYFVPSSFTCTPASNSSPDGISFIISSGSDVFGPSVPRKYPQLVVKRSKEKRGRYIFFIRETIKIKGSEDANKVIKKDQ